MKRINKNEKEDVAYEETAKSKMLDEKFKSFFSSESEIAAEMAGEIDTNRDYDKEFEDWAGVSESYKKRSTVNDIKITLTIPKDSIECRILSMMKPVFRSQIIKEAFMYSCSEKFNPDNLFLLQGLLHKLKKDKFQDSLEDNHRDNKQDESNTEVLKVIITYTDREPLCQAIALMDTYQRAPILRECFKAIYCSEEEKKLLFLRRGFISYLKELE